MFFFFYNLVLVNNKNPASEVNQIYSLLKTFLSVFYTIIPDDRGYGQIQETFSALETSRTVAEITAVASWPVWCLQIHEQNSVTIMNFDGNQL